jgi:hypothetical protein
MWAHGYAVLYHTSTLPLMFRHWCIVFPMLYFVQSNRKRQADILRLLGIKYTAFLFKPLLDSDSLSHDTFNYF